MTRLSRANIPNGQAGVGNPVPSRMRIPLQGVFKTALGGASPGDGRGWRRRWSGWFDRAIASRQPTVIPGPGLRGLICMVVANLCAAPLLASSGDYLVDVWTTEAGLPNSSVTAVAQTPDGYLWVGTYNGLARFDGVRFVNFAPGGTPELASARIRRLYCDDGGTLWINTYDGSLTSYRHGRFQLEWVGDGSPDAAVTLISQRGDGPVFLLRTGDLIRHRGPVTGATNAWQVLRPPGAGSGELAVEDGAGVIWRRGRDQKLWCLSGDEFRAVPTNSGLAGTVINALVKDRQGRVWVGTDKEFAVWEDGRFADRTPTNSSGPVNVRFLHVARNGDVWVTADDKVLRASGRQWVAEAEACRGVFTGYRDRLGMHDDGAGGVWIYDYGKGLYHVRADGRARPLTVDDDFPGERVDCFFEDREGNLWAGVDRGGLVRVRERRFTVLSPGDSPVAKAAVTVAEDREGAIWVGTFGGGLHRWMEEEWESFTMPGGPRQGFVFSLFPDADRRLWLSAGEEDLYTGQAGQFQAVTPAVHGVKAVLVARDGRVWLGTKNGLAMLTRGQLRRFTPEDGVQRVDVRALAEAPDGVIWAGAGDGTLYRVENNRAEAFRARDPWAGHAIWSLLVDADGIVWAGTFRGGLLRLERGEFARCMSQHGLPDDVVSQLLDDGRGWLWIGSQQGVFRVHKTELKLLARGRQRGVNCTAYGRYDGLPSLECSGGYQPAAWRTSDGTLLFATLKGVASIRPGEFTVNQLPPPVSIEEVLLDGRPSRPQELVPSVTQPPGERYAPIEVPPGKRQIEFRYTALSFVSPDRVRFRYQLEGVDRDWIEAGSARRSVTYSFVRPGEYRFRIAACNNDGIWNNDGAGVLLRVQPFFYQTWWFYGALGFAGIGAVAAVVRRVVVRDMRLKLERLERQRAVERDRARIAKDIHDDLGAGLTHITLLTELARRSPAAETPTHLTHITDTARELTRAMDETVWAINPGNDSLEGLMTYATKFAQEYLNVAGIRCRLDLPAQLPPCMLEAEARHNLYLAIKEALNNVVKHAHATEVWIRVAVRKGECSVVIEDNGRGLGDPAGRTETPSADRISSGHGLGNLEKRLAACGGRCAVTSEQGRGTRIELTLRLPGRS